MVNFYSDNVSGAAPAILEALGRANEGAAMSYGADPLTARVEARLQEIFETDCAAFPVATGTAANALGLSVMTPPYGAIYCHREAHVHTDECAAPELFTGGAKLIVLDGPQGKLQAETLAGAITGAGDVHMVQPAAISVTQASEAGTLYTLDELAAMGQVAREHGLGLQMDGARFANALVALGCSPAEMTWKAGVDVLSLGATKNGALAAEAVVIFKRDLAGSFAYRRKRGGHLFSKMRFLSAQLDAYLSDDLWLRNAAHANRAAGRLAAGLDRIAGVELLYPVEANEIFARLPAGMIEGLSAEGFGFSRSGPAAERIVRLVTAFNTPEAHVDQFLAAAARLAAESERRRA
jgi:threonine aldolase